MNASFHIFVPNDEGEKVEVIVCGCEMMEAAGLYRGSYWNDELGRNCVVNAYLCEYCADTISDTGRIRKVKTQRIPGSIYDRLETYIAQKSWETETD